MNNYIYIVSGLPRTGTSMMMKMLAAGGVEVVTDSIRESDIDNPRGYYEYEKVKTIKEDKSWLKDLPGKAVKMVSKLLYELPKDYQYKIIFMERDLQEVLASQKKMLRRKGKKQPAVDEDTMQKYYENHLAKIHNWLSNQGNMDVLRVNYNKLMENPYNYQSEFDKFYANNIDVEKMFNIIDQNLYRNQNRK